MMFLSKKTLVLLLLALLGSLPNSAFGQVRAGSAYLKILPGTRQQSLANSLTGALDDTYLLYANPGAAGLLREWQWSANYTEWIADIYNVSLLYGKHVRLKTPWSRVMTFALGLNYQGIRNFDATGGIQAPVTASDLLINASVGLPIGFARNFSLGANIKYLRSELAQYNANGFIFDVGMLYRTPRFRLSNSGLFEYGILSGGVSINQLGPSLKFIDVATPLPRTVRAGLALNLGRHDGIQLQISGDYHSVKDEGGRFSFGTQITNLLSPLSSRLGRSLALRGGYNFIDNRHTDLLGKFSLGFSFRLDDYMNSDLKSAANNRGFPGSKNSALRMDFALIDSRKFSSVYQGGVTNHPIGPEHFDFIESDYQSFDIEQKPELSYNVCETVRLAWETSRDPELYDDVNYWVLLAKGDSAALSQYIENPNKLVRDYTDSTKTRRGYEEAQNKSDSTEIRFVDLTKGTPKTSYARKNRSVLSSSVYFKKDTHGDYFWTVLAYDNNHHFRIVGDKIARFHVKPAPVLDIQITKRSNPKQCVAEVVLKNSSNVDLDQDLVFRILAFQSTNPPFIYKPAEEQLLTLIGVPSAGQIIDWELSPPGKLIKRIVFAGMKKDDVFKFEVPWQEDYPLLLAEIDSGNVNCANYTDRDSLRMYDLEITKTADVPPLRPNVQFALNDSSLTADSKRQLDILGKALSSPKLVGAYIHLEGHTDTQGFANHTPEQSRARNLKLSQGRVRSVRRYLLDRYSFASDRICEIGYGQKKPRFLLQNIIDKKEIKEINYLNRRVEMYLLKEQVPGNSVTGECSQATVPDSLMMDVVSQGTEILYKLNVINNGPGIARNVELQDSVLGFVNINAPNALHIGNTLSWRVGELSAGQDTTITYTAMVDSLEPSESVYELVNYSTIADPCDASPGNNSASDPVWVMKRLPH